MKQKKSLDLSIFKTRFLLYATCKVWYLLKIVFITEIQYKEESQ